MNDRTEGRGAAGQGDQATYNLRISLEILSRPQLKLDVQGVEGDEAISTLYRFYAYATTSDRTEAASLIGERAKLQIETAQGTCRVSGILFEVEERDPTPIGLRTLVFTLMPRFAETTLATENRIYGSDQAKGVDDIIKAEMSSAGTVPASYILGSYPKRNYVVQYRETDFAFISRQCENAGIFYYFNQESSGETVVFGDQNLAFPKVNFGGGSTSLLYGPPRDNNRQGRGATESAVLSFTALVKAVSKTVKLRDYNEATPRVVSGEKAVGAGAGYLGIVQSFGEHFADDTEGGTLAGVRAEEIAAQRQVFTATTDAPELKAGMIFEMRGHPSLNGEYLVTSARHTAYRPAPVGFSALPVGGAAYRNVIQCIKSDVPFRPARVTARPVAMGIHIAKVDGELWGGRAEIDGEGRYKLQMTFPDAGSSRARGSDYMRKSEPYLGPAQTGLHFPLIAGTEVLVAYINGDIDRPVILGAVANPDWKSLVTGNNHMYNRLKSQSGAVFEIYDGPV